MKRRQALCASVALTLTLLQSRSLIAQGGTPTTVIGLLDAGQRLEWWDAFRQKLRALGYVEGRNVSLQQRYAKGRLELLPALANELVQLKVAVIVTSGAAAAVAAQHATATIPIVMASGTDQVSLGLVSSLGRPGSNVTGVSTLTSELMAKRFELLRGVVPKSSRVAVIWHADNVPSMSSVRELEGAAAKSQVALQSFGIRDAGELPNVFSAMTRQHIEAAIVVNSPLIYTWRLKIVELALANKIPAIYGAAEYADAGGLISYAPSYPEMFRHAAVYVDKILKGANPGDQPIEQPTTLELVINLRTARALGVAIPPSMLATASRVID